MSILAVDTETTGTDFWHGCRPFMVTACNGKKNYVFQGEVDGPTRNVHWDHDDIDRINNLIADHRQIVFHNTNFDMRALETINVDIKPIWKKFQDTLAASHLLCSSDIHGLKELAIKYLAYPDYDEQELQLAVVEARELNPTWKAKPGHPHFPATKTAKFWKMDMWMEPELCKKYAVHDVQRTWLLWKAFRTGLLQDRTWNMYEFRRDLLPILYRMQTTGIHLYTDKARELLRHLNKQRDQLCKLIQDESNAIYDINPAKSSSLRYLLFDLLNLTPVKYNKKGPSTDAESLNKLLEDNDNTTLKYLRAWRKVDKKRSSVISYIKWSHNDRVHSSLNLTGTHWTRQTSNDPNQQNFDKSMTTLWGPPEGFYWLYADIVNIELRIFAYEVNSKALIEAFEKNLSVHMIIAQALYPELIAELGEDEFKKTKVYTKCKGGTFARMYGGGIRKVETTYGVANACAIIDAKIPEVGAYFRKLNEDMKRNFDREGYPTIYTRQGYRLEVPIFQPHTVPSARIQGTAGLIVQDMMNTIANDPFCEIRNCEMVQQVHDSLTIEIPNHPEHDFTNKYIIRKMEETGRRHLPTCPMDYEVIVPKLEAQKLIDYTNIDDYYGKYRVMLYKKKVTDQYNWFCQLTHKDTKETHVFQSRYRPDVIKLAKEFVG